MGTEKNTPHVDQCIGKALACFAVITRFGLTCPHRQVSPNLVISRWLA